MGLLDIVAAEAQKQGIDPAFALSIAQQESGGRAGLTSSKGATGPMQLMPATAKDLGVDPTNPLDNIRGGVTYLGQMLKRYGGDKRLAAAAYNAGPGAVDKSLATTGDIPNYAETQDYVNKTVGPKVNTNGIDPSWLESADGAKPSAGAAAAPQAASGPQPAKVDPSWLEDAKPSAKPTDTAAAPSSLWDKAKAVNAKIASAFPNPFSVVGIGPGGDQPGKLDPKLAAGIKGAALPITLADKYAVQPLARALGGGEDQDLGSFIDANTRAPQGVIEQGATKAAGYVGNAVGAAPILKGAGALAGAANLPRVANFLGQAGAINGSMVGGAVGGGAASDVADVAGRKLGLTPGARLSLDTVAGLAGGLPGASLGGRLANGVAPDVAKTLAAADASGVPVQLSNVSPGWEAARKLADKVPFGSAAAGNTAENQVAAVKQAFTTTAEKYRPSGLADSAGTSGTDKFIADDLRSQYNTAKGNANDAYAKVQQVMDANPDLPPIPLQSTKDALAQVLDEYPKALSGIQLSRGNRRVLGTLEDALKTPEAEAAGPTIVNVGGKPMNVTTMPPQLRAQLEQQGVIPPAPPAPEAPSYSLQDARKLSSALWNEISRAQGTREMSADQLGLMKKLAGAVGADVDGYMAQAPKPLQDAYAQADSIFKSQVVPFRADPKVYKLVSSQTPKSDYDLHAQGLYQNLFNTSQGERSAMALQLMSPKGQSAATYQALKDAADTATSSASPTGLKVAAANRKLDIENNPALANIAANNPQFAQDAERLSSILQVGRQAATQVAGKGALTGFQNRQVAGGAALYGMGKGAAALGLGPVGGAGMLAGGIGAANLVTLLNRMGPGALRNFMLANPGSFGQRAVPGAVQGLLQSQDDDKR